MSRPDRTFNPDRLRHFVIFIGNPRSGTTLVRSLLNAHPEVLIANEADVLRSIEQGANRAGLLQQLIDNEASFARQPVWTGHDYVIPLEPTPWPAPIRVIGDKKAGRTVRAAFADRALIDQLGTLIAPLSLKVIHCVRDPLDCIATRSVRSEKPLERQLEAYFEVETMVAELARQSALSDLHRVYLEQLIANPGRGLTELLAFLHLEAPAGYFDACQGLIADKPGRTRNQVAWSRELLARVTRQVDELPHLHPYSASDLPAAG